MQTVECDKIVSSLYELFYKLVFELGKQIQKSQKKRWAVDTARVSISQTVHSTRSDLIVQ